MHHIIIVSYYNFSTFVECISIMYKFYSKKKLLFLNDKKFAF